MQTDTADFDRYLSDVVSLAHEIKVREELNTSLHLSPTSGHEPEVTQALAEAEKRVSEPTLRSFLCPALATVSTDVRDIAKVVAAALLPLSLAGTVTLSAAPLAMAALAVVIARAGVATICPPNEETKSSER